MTEYVVERFNWQLLNGGLVRRPGVTRVRACPTADAADAHARRLELAARAVADPFAPVWNSWSDREDGGHAGRLRSPAHATDLPEWALTDWLLDHDIAPPVPGADGRLDWPAWWRASAADRPAAVWDALTKVRFYRVRELLAGPPVFAVLRVRWFSGQQYEAQDVEGGELVAVHADRGDADADAARWTAAVLAESDAADRYLMGRRPFPGQKFLSPDPPARWRPNYPVESGERDARDVPHYEVHEVGCAPGVRAAGVLVTWNSFRSDVSWHDAAVVPDRLFPDRQSADEWVAAIEAEARRDFPVAWYGGLDGDWRTGEFDLAADVAAALDMLDLPPLGAPADPPTHGFERFREWWAEHGAAVTPDQNAALWDLFGYGAAGFASTSEVRVLGG